MQFDLVQVQALNALLSDTLDGAYAAELDAIDQRLDTFVMPDDDSASARLILVARALGRELRRIGERHGAETEQTGLFIALLLAQEESRQRTVR